MQFYSRVRRKRERQTPPHGEVFPQVLLLRSDWDDYGRHTTFDVHYFASAADEDYHRHAGIHIVHQTEQVSELPSEFTEVPPEYLTLGGSVRFYRWIVRVMGQELAADVLARLRDVVITPSLRDTALECKNFQISALREDEAEEAFHSAGAIFGLAAPADEPFNFAFQCQLVGFDEPHVVDIDFSPAEGDPEGAIPHRLFCFVGKNGTGKSGVLARLAGKLSARDSEGSEFLTKRPLVRRTICVSYSPFQPFPYPYENTSSYKYCGLQEEHGFIHADSLRLRTRDAFDAVLRKDRLSEWGRLVHLQDITGHLTEEVESVEQLENSLATLSTGQRMVATIATDLIAAIDTQCLVLIDEPEAYLHPTLLSTFLRVVEKILEEYKSYAVLATHSPIVVQEVPSRNVRVFERVYDLPRVRRLPIESFGASLTDLVDRVFAMNPDDKNYQVHLKAAVRDLGGIENVRRLFSEPTLTLNAQLFLDSLAQTKAGSEKA